VSRHRTVAAAFTRVVEGVGDWDAPTPCEGWRARDVVAHLCEWVPAYFAGTWDLPAPDVTDDPVADWHALDAFLQGGLDDPDVAGRVRDTRFGPATFASQVDQIVTGDVLVHTWDLARASGQDDALDPDEVRTMLADIEPMIDALVSSGHYGPPVPVPEGADEQTRLLGLLGRRV
jgi:uncharacterized protein (TIGR03086 family)